MTWPTPKEELRPKVLKLAVTLADPQKNSIMTGDLRELRTDFGACSAPASVEVSHEGSGKISCGLSTSMHADVSSERTGKTPQETDLISEFPTFCNTGSPDEALSWRSACSTSKPCTNCQTAQFEDPLRANKILTSEMTSLHTWVVDRIVIGAHAG